MNSSQLIFIFFSLSCLFERTLSTDTLLPDQLLNENQTLISSGQRFELGFFSIGKFKNKYLGIRYKITPNVIVWVANRNIPLIDSQEGVLTLNKNGTIFLINNSGAVIWSANITSTTSSPVVKLLDTGNLVVQNDSDVGSDKYIWQSFNYAGNTRLPGMLMGENPKTGQEMHLTSWKSADDPSAGDFIFNGMNIVSHKQIQGITDSGNRANVFFLTDQYNASDFNRLILTQAGIAQRYVLNQAENKWENAYTVPDNFCDFYGQCGPNSICNLKKSPHCRCLDRFSPKSGQEWKSLNWSGGCERSASSIDCLDKANDTFVMITGAKLPDLLTFQVREKMNLSECEAECHRNCSCTAYANPYTDSPDSACLMWYGDLLDIREYPMFQFSAVASATKKFSSANLIGEGGFGPVYKGLLSTGQEVAVKRLSKNSGQGSEEFRNEVTLIAKLQHRNLVRLLGCCIQGEERMLIYEYMQNNSMDHFIFDRTRKTLLPWPKRFSSILGIARGLLYLHQDSRLKIIHRDLKTSNILLDRDLVPKISDFGLARIFGFDQDYAKTKRVIGTYGYMAPEYAIDGKFSVKSDVFSIGVLILEIISGKKNRSFSHPDHHHTLLGHAWLLWNENRALELMDSCLQYSYVEDQVKRCAQVGLLCVQQLVEDRPEMSSVVFMLSKEEANLPQPKEPGFFSGRSSFHEDTHTYGSEECNTDDMKTITDLEAR